MRQSEVISVLCRNEAAIRSLGVAALFVYGSHARDEAGPNSDVDLFVDRNLDQKFGLFELARLHRTLETILGTEVDVGTRTSLHPMLKADIERSALQVF
jgi:uncharacterized protein